MRLQDDPLYKHLKTFKEAHQWDLMLRYGAHSIGIAWKRRAGRKTADLALTFYVSRKLENPDRAVPEFLSFVPEGRSKAVKLVTDVVEMPLAAAEVSAK